MDFWARSSWAYAFVWAMGIERNHYQISFKVLYDSTRVDTMTSAYHKQMVKKVSTKGNRVAN